MPVAEQLNGVAVGIMEIDALGHSVVSSMIDLYSQLIEAVAEFPQRLNVFDLKGHMVESEAARRNRRGVGRRSK